jgi:hypothetical protein
MVDRLGKIVAILVLCTVSEANAASNKKIDLQCYFEGGDRMRFEGVFSRSSGTNEEGTGVARIDVERGANWKAVFRLDRGIDGKGPGILLIYAEPFREKDTNIVSDRRIYQVDRGFRVFSVLQQDPITSPTPFTQISVGTCSGIF